MIKYLQDRPWSDWTRDERFFCSVLYGHAQKDVPGFSSWIIREAGLTISDSGEWDLGYEVSFYRDYLWQSHSTASSHGLPSHRAFDLCLFGEHAIVIIEAKVFGPFTTKQNKSFGQDKSRIATIPALSGIDTRLVALASSRYFDNQAKFGKKDTLAVFDGRVSWSGLASLYSDQLLDQADRTYKLKPTMAV